MRTWIATLTARSAVCLAENKQLSIVAGPESTVPMIGVRIRNHNCRRDDGKTFVGGLVAEAAGRFNTMEEAVAILANHHASPYFQLAALAANAAIDEPEDLIAHCTPEGNKAGEWIVQRHTQPRAPAPVVRLLLASDFMELLKLVGKHPDEERLHRATAHYRMALSQLEPQNWVLAAESLFMATENLERVVVRRLLKEAGLPDDGPGKHELAIRKGFIPKDKDDRSHMNQLDSWIREKHIFGGDKTSYKELKFASDHFEHGSRSFGEVQKAATSARVAFKYVRRSILHEMGLQATSPLFDKKYDIALGDWRPALELSGTYTDSADPAPPELTPETVNEAWPDFLGPSAIPMMSGVIDEPDGKTRTLSFSIKGNAHTLTVTQKLQILKQNWAIPRGREEELPPDALKITELKINGKDIDPDKLLTEIQKNDPEPAGGE